MVGIFALIYRTRIARHFGKKKINRTIQQKVDRNISDLASGEMVGLKIVDFDSKPLKIGDFHSKLGDFHGIKDNFWRRLGPKTSIIPEYQFWGVIRPWGT